MGRRLLIELMGFQAKAFQTPVAFQAHIAPPAGGLWAWSRPSKEKERLEERIESLPDIVQDAIEESINIESTAQRRSAFRAKLSSVEFKFQRLYLELMERYRAIWIEEQLQIELERIRIQREDDDTAAILLLLS